MSNRFDCLREDSCQQDSVKEKTKPSDNIRFKSLKQTRRLKPVENTRFASLKPIKRYKPVENTRFANLKPVERYKPVENTLFNGHRPSLNVRDSREESVMRNYRFESLKPIKKPPRESKRETFRQQPVEHKFEQLGSIDGMFSNLSIKPKQNKKKKKKKKIVYEEEEESDKEDYKTTIEMLNNFYPKEESEEEDNSAW